MSARERFFPRIPKSNPTPTFVDDTNNPLQRSASGSQESVLTALDKLHNNGTTQPSGLNGWRKLSSRDSASRKPSLSGSVVGGVRPGTADPLAQEGQFPVLAPAPKRLGQVSPPLMISDGMSATLASEDTITTLGNHSLNSSGDSNEDANDTSRIVTGRYAQASKNPFMKKSGGPQRVMIEDGPSHHRPRSLNRAGDASPTSANGAENEGGMPVSSLLGRKRMREDDPLDDNDTIVRQTKRFKNHENGRDKESYSPMAERPSSGRSSVASAHRRQPNTEIQGHAQPQRFLHDQHDHFEPSSSPSNGMQCEQPNIASSDIRGLDRLLGPGSNDYLDQHMEKYEASVKKWSECSLDEWKAGAEQISGLFTKIIDFAKTHVDKKLKAYSEFNDILDAHEETLKERNTAMELWQRKLVKESGNVLG